MSLLVTVATPVLAMLGSLLGQFLTVRAERRLERRARREETMRNLRWAAELAVDDGLRQARLGVAQLIALARSDLLDVEERIFVDAALDLVVAEVRDDPVFDPGNPGSGVGSDDS